MSAEDGENAMQNEAVDQEEELAIGVEKLKVVSLSTTFCPFVWRPCQSRDSQDVQLSQMGF
jgi:hypothetical protein